jgi:uncharacterized protein YjbI with pentapeptide repeats
MQMPGAELADVAIMDCILTEAYLASSSFKHVVFENCDLSRVTFEGSDLAGVCFRKCNLSGADLRGAKLQSADFRSSDLSGVQIAGKDLQGAIIEPGQAAQVISLLGVRVMDADESSAGRDDHSPGDT